MEEEVRQARAVELIAQKRLLDLHMRSQVPTLLYWLHTVIITHHLMAANGKPFLPTCTQCILVLLPARPCPALPCPAPATPSACWGRTPWQAADILQKRSWQLADISHVLCSCATSQYMFLQTFFVGSADKMQTAKAFQHWQHPVLAANWLQSKALIVEQQEVAGAIAAAEEATQQWLAKLKGMEQLLFSAQSAQFLDIRKREAEAYKVGL